ncbi:hypothetical protein LINGRAHAP2_LOCUS3572 [Linum grandiflorum]
MDYDDNDFQSQNLHLAGEGSNKFPPVLNPYALPKFEFDDNIHVPLRYDSLVETEVFLGIENNEDSQWIEDYSPASNTIQFASSAAESCSILRQNNVWSEATSSESVEMLLRSVGNEENFPLQASAKKLDACDELGCMINQMEPSSKQDSNLPNRAVDFADVQQTLRSADIAERFPALNGEAEAQQRLDQGVSDFHDGGDCFGNGLDDLTAVGAGGELSAAVENEFIDGKCDVVGQSAGNTVVYESLAIRTVESDGPELQVDIVDTENRAEDDHVLDQATESGDGIKHTVELDADDCKEERVELDVDDSKEEMDVLDEAEIGVSQEISDATMVEAGGKVLQSPVCSAPVENVSEANISDSNLSSMEGPYTLRTETDLAENLEATDVSRGSESILVVHVDNRAQDGSSSVSQLLTDSFVTSSVVIPAPEEEGPSADGNESVEVSHAHDSYDYNILATKACKDTPASFVAESLQRHEREIVPQEDEDRRISLDGLVQQNKSSESPSNGGKMSESPSNSGTIKNEVQNSLIADRSIGTLPSVGVDAKVMGVESSVDVAAGEATARNVDPSIVDVTSVSALGSAQISEDGGKDIPLSGLSEGTTIVGPVLELEKGAPGASGQGLNSNVDESLSMVDECSQKDHIDTDAASMNEDAPESSKGIEECSVPPTSMQKEDNAVIVEKTEEEASPTKGIEECSAPPTSMQKEDNAVIAEETKEKASPTKEIEECSVPPTSTQKEDNAVIVEETKEKASPTDQDNVSKQDASQKGHVEDEAVLAIGTNDKQDSRTERSECGTTAADPEKQSVASSIVVPTTELSEAHRTEEINRYPHFSPSASVDADKSFSHESKKDTPSKDDGSFTFQVTPLTESPQVENAKKLQLMQTVEPIKVSMAMEVSPSTPGLSQLPEFPQVENTNKLQLLHAVEPSKPMDASPSMPVLGQVHGKIVQDISHQSPMVSDGTIHQVGAKANSERKPRRRATPKASAKRVKTPKEITPAKMERGNKAIITPSSSVVAERAQPNEVQRFGHLDNSGLKSFVGTSIAGLPDLNSSASAMVFQQPFTDMQQVQLRAQIFAYGALIQGTAPEEAYMVSAFGGPDGGKSAWEKPWRVFVERLNSQITHLNTPGTAVQSFSGARAPDQSSKQSTRKVKAMSSPGARSSSKATTPIASPILPLSTPLWNASTPSDHMQSIGMARSPVLDFQRTLSPLPSHQSPAMRNLVAHSPWVSQGHFGPWMTSPQTSTVDTGGRFTVQMPHTEPVHLTPVKESSVPLSSAMKHISAPLVTYTDPSGNLLANTSMPEVSKMVIASGQQSAIPKPRKRKKSSVPENTFNMSLLHQPSNEFAPSAVITTPVSFVPKPTAENFPTSASPLTTNIRKADLFADQRINSSEESLGKVKEARVHAEDAAALAATAVSQSQEVWSKLDKQKNAGLPPDVEAKLASAAVAIAAAAAVAKAAAAAAKVAANAALQARLMADEATAASGSYADQTSVISFSDEMRNLGNATPASILRRDNGTSSSSSIILAAKETARKRVEAASAASKRAENMDAIIRAAELAAEAVSQAGKIVAMGDPLPLSVLASTGPVGYWKDPQVSPQRVSKANELVTVNLNVPGDSARSTAKEGLSISHEKSIAQTGTPSGKDAKELKGAKSSETTLEVVLEDGSGPKSPTTSETENVEAVGSSKGSVIREGTTVEILRDGNGFKAAWFSAKVLNLRDGLAHVSYDELTSGEGSEKLTEWVALREEGAEAPKIRISRPIIALPYEGTRKRRRAAVNDYNWSVGDRVDAWIRESWWEGVVTEKNKKDGTHLTVYFPVQGETSVVRAWHLRPSLVWKDGEWIECSNSQQKNISSNTGDTPKEKRPRMHSPVAESKDKASEPTLLNLGTGETVFNAGKATEDGSRTARIGLQKEGSKVVFGVPKPGKKRKFMEVSKHYVAGRTEKTNEQTDQANEPAKSAKYSTPQVSGPRGWRSTPKTDAIEKRTTTTAAFAAPKSKLPKPGGNKPNPTSGRTIPQKENSSNSAGSTPSGGGAPAFTDNNLKTAKTSAGGSEKESSMDRTNSSSGEPIVFSAVARRSDAVSSKKLSTTNTRSVRGNKGKFAPSATGRLGKVDEGKVLNSAASAALGQSSLVSEPRRSVRRIQPTSRLLEGLQSSLMVSKIPSVSHDKSHKSRPPVRGNSNG